MSRDDEIRDLLGNTAKELSRLSHNPRAWLAWMVYLLGCLEQIATNEEPRDKDLYRDMLAALQDAIRNRLRTGGW
jgi:hypothetical protein